MGGTVAYYVQGEASFQEQFRLSYRQLRRWHDGPVVVITDLQDGWDPSRGYQVGPIPSGITGWGGKTVLFDCVDAQRVLFLDCDVLVLGPLSGVWETLSRADLALVRDCHSTVGEAAYFDTMLRLGEFHADEMGLTPQIVGPDHPYYNAGIVGWKRNNTVRAFFQKWHAEWLRTRTSDQYPMVRALRQSRIRVAELPGTYNFWGKDMGRLADAQAAGIVCLHFWGAFKHRMIEFVDDPTSRR